MKNSLEKLVLLLMFIGLADSFAIAQTTINEDMPVHFSISSTGINRFIADQWGLMTTNWSGTHQGMSYSMELNRPVVDLSENTFRIILSLQINAQVNGTTIFNEDATISPEVYIPPASVDPSGVIEDVRALYNNLEQAINDAPIPDQRIRDVLEDKLGEIEWVIYQGEILRQLSIRWLETSDVSFVGLPVVQFSIEESKLVLTITPQIESNFPEYSFQWRRPGSNSYEIRILSNNKIELKSVSVSTTAGQDSPTNVSIESSYNQNFQKYIAIYSFVGGTTAGTLMCKVRIMRQEVETVWTVSSFTYGGVTNWENFTNIDPVWGE